MDTRTETNRAIDLVYNHAGQQWIDTAWRATWRFYHLLPVGGVFQSHDLIEFAEAQYGQDALPHDRRAWGGILRTLVQDGQVERAGFEMSKSSRRHGAPVAVWQKV